MPSLKLSPSKLTGRVRSSSRPGRSSLFSSPVAIISAMHHRGGFERLDLVLAIVCGLRAVLHDQNAERAAGAQHRHAEEGVIDLFARLRQVGEGRDASARRTG